MFLIKLRRSVFYKPMRFINEIMKSIFIGLNESCDINRIIDGIDDVISIFIVRFCTSGNIYMTAKLCRILRIG